MLARQYEKEFSEDMSMLGVQSPDIATRVSEYIPEIVEFIEKLVTKGIANESNGSVYFSTSAFEGQGHTYGKLMPEMVGNEPLFV